MLPSFPHKLHYTVLQENIAGVVCASMKRKDYGLMLEYDEQKRRHKIFHVLSLIYILVTV